jgi:hypothetical protein
MIAVNSAGVFATGDPALLVKESQWQSQQKTKSASALRNFGKKTIVQPDGMMSFGIRPSGN